MLSLFVCAEEERRRYAKWCLSQLPRILVFPAACLIFFVAWEVTTRIFARVHDPRKVSFFLFCIILQMGGQTRDM